MIDRIVHHADVITLITLKGASYRLRRRDIHSLASIRTTTTTQPDT